MVNVCLKVAKKVGTLGGAQQREQYVFLTISISKPISATRKEPVCKISGQKEGLDIRYGRNS